MGAAYRGPFKKEGGIQSRSAEFVHHLKSAQCDPLPRAGSIQPRCTVGTRKEDDPPILRVVLCPLKSVLVLSKKERTQEYPWRRFWRRKSLCPLGASSWQRPGCSQEGIGGPVHPNRII